MNRKLLNKKAQGKLDTQAKIDKANKIIENIKQYKNWKETLPPRDKKDLVAMGPIGYLTGETLREGEKTE